MTNPINLSPYTMGFSLAVREVADGKTYPHAIHTAYDAFGPVGYQEFVLGYLAAHEIDRELEEAVA